MDTISKRYRRSTASDAERMTRVNFTLPPDLAAAFRAHCAERGLNMSALVSELIEREIGGR